MEKYLAQLGPKEPQMTQLGPELKGAVNLNTSLRYMWQFIEMNVADQEEGDLSQIASLFLVKREQKSC